MSNELITALQVGACMLLLYVLLRIAAWWRERTEKAETA
jgi:hypothetical protein